MDIKGNLAQEIIVYCWADDHILKDSFRDINLNLQKSKGATEQRMTRYMIWYDHVQNRTFGALLGMTPHAFFPRGECSCGAHGEFSSPSPLPPSSHMALKLAAVSAFLRVIPRWSSSSSFSRSLFIRLR
jgi:hypothetical protein